MHTSAKGALLEGFRTAGVIVHNVTLENGQVLGLIVATVATLVKHLHPGGITALTVLLENLQVQKVYAPNVLQEKQVEVARTSALSVA